MWGKKAAKITELEESLELEEAARVETQRQLDALLNSYTEVSARLRGQTRFAESVNSHLASFIAFREGDPDSVRALKVLCSGVLNLKMDDPNLPSQAAHLQSVFHDFLTKFAGLRNDLAHIKEAYEGLLSRWSKLRNTAENISVRFSPDGLRLNAVQILVERHSLVFPQGAQRLADLKQRMALFNSYAEGIVPDIVKLKPANIDPERLMYTHGRQLTFLTEIFNLLPETEDSEIHFSEMHAALSDFHKTQAEGVRSFLLQMEGALAYRRGAHPEESLEQFEGHFTRLQNSCKEIQNQERELFLELRALSKADQVAVTERLTLLTPIINDLEAIRVEARKEWEVLRAAKVGTREVDKSIGLRSIPESLRSVAERKNVELLERLTKWVENFKNLENFDEVNAAAVGAAYVLGKPFTPAQINVRTDVLHEVSSLIEVATNRRNKEQVYFGNIANLKTENLL